MNIEKESITAKENGIREVLNVPAAYLLSWVQGIETATIWIDDLIVNVGDISLKNDIIEMLTAIQEDIWDMSVSLPEA